MKVPRWLLGLSVLFWGWETGLTPFALMMAVALEASYVIRARWELTDKDLNRICDLCTVLFLAAALLLYSTEDRLVVVFKFTQWLPFCFFPVAVAQSFGDRSSIPLSAFSWLLRRIPHSPLARVSFNVSYAYFAVNVMAASASTPPHRFFYTGVSVLILLALSNMRPNRVSWPGWIALAAAAMLCGKFSHEFLRQAQNKMENALGSWIGDLFRSAQDPRECATRIGKSGGDPVSAKIVLRVHVPPGEVPPGLLREAAYDGYKRGTWTASGTNQFIQISLNTNETVRLLAPKPVFSEVQIAGYFPEGAGLLPLPHGTFELYDFPGLMETNRMGVAEVAAGPGLLDYRAQYWTGASMDGPPDSADRNVPEEEKPALNEVITNLGLNGMTERQKIRAIGRFFNEQFKYSLSVPIRQSFDEHKTALGRFLTEVRMGHCEYFATATVLLLRQAGLSARYVTGFAVPETARRGDTYLVRERHRHAWALVYHSEDTKTWEQVDNTPSSWEGEVDSSPPWWQPESDFMSNLFFQFSRWRWGKTSISRYAQWALAPLILYLVWRILSTRRNQKKSLGGLDGQAGRGWPGLDSELYVINRHLAAIHLSRQANEPLSGWQQRLEEAFPESQTLRGIFQLHRRLRFDPVGLQSKDREALRLQASQWLAEFSAQREKDKQANH